MPTFSEPSPPADIDTASDPVQSRILESILGTVSDGIVVADAGGRFVVFNQAAERILGHGRMDVPPESWPQAYGLFLPDRVTPYPADRLPLVRAIGGEVVHGAEMYVHGPGRPAGRVIHVTATPWLAPSGERLGGVAVFRDVTPQAVADDMVRRLSNAVEQTADAVYITDREGVIEYVNPGFESMTGYARTEVLGRTPRVLRSGRHDPVHYRELWDTLLAGRVFRGTMVNRRRDGQTYYAEMTITPIRGPSGAVTHFVAVGKDMTDRRARQEQALEMGVARAVQRRLFPSGPPSLPGFDIAAVAMPAAATCGDYYDFIHVGAGRLAVAIADVSGHGLGPALVMSQTRAYLRAYLHTLADPGEVLRQLNLTLIGDLEPGRFVTMLLARLDPRDRSLVFANAGHPPGLVLRADGELRATLDSRGTPLGVWPARSVAGAEPVTLEPGDTVVLVTDGITESQAPDGRLFGTEGVLAAVRAHLGGSARDVRDGLIADARAFAAGGAPTDDLTAIVCKVAPDR